MARRVSRSATRSYLRASSLSTVPSPNQPPGTDAGKCHGLAVGGDGADLDEAADHAGPVVEAVAPVTDVGAGRKPPLGDALEARAASASVSASAQKAILSQLVFRAHASPAGWLASSQLRPESRACSRCRLVPRAHPALHHAADRASGVSGMPLRRPMLAHRNCDIREEAAHDRVRAFHRRQARSRARAGASATSSSRWTARCAPRLPLASKAEVAAAVENAKAAQPAWAATNPQRRARVLMKFLELANRDYDKLADCLAREHGKTVADAKGDIQRGLEVVEFACGIPHLMKGEYTEGAGPGIDLYSMRQPLGVVAGITPFNFPAMIPLWKCAPGHRLRQRLHPEAVGARPRRAADAGRADDGGRACRPASSTSSTATRRRSTPSSTIPTSQAIGFVGSTPIAEYIYARGCAAGKRVQCFGGAKNHMIVMPDADMDQAVDALVGAGYGSAGERCMAVSVAVPVGTEDGRPAGGEADPARGEPEDRPLHLGGCRLRPAGDGGAPQEGEGLRRRSASRKAPSCGSTAATSRCRATRTASTWAAACSTR